MTWFSTSTSKMQGFTTNPCNVLRGTRNPSGLFDTDENTGLLSYDDALDYKTAEDIFKNLGSEGSVCDDHMTLSDDPSWTVDGSFGTLDDVFGMDIFTDLSDYISENSIPTNVEPMTMADWQNATDDATTSLLAGTSFAESVVPDTSFIAPEETAAQKRKLSEVSVDSAELDHGGYTTKRSKSDSDSDEDEKEVIKKSDKYAERRIKNNVASKRSRETRKQKFVQMEEQAVDLVAQNEMLRTKIAEMEQLACSMKKILVQHMAKK